MDDDRTITPSTPEAMEQSDKEEITGNNASLQKALGPLMNKFRSLRESVKSDYADLKQTITKQKEVLQQELVDKIDNNARQLSSVCQENKILRKENDALKTRLDKLEQDQLRNNVMITGIQEGPYKQYSTTKL